MGEGFPLWSLAPMAWEGREPLRDWICLSVSLCFCVPRFCPFTVSFISGDPKLWLGWNLNTISIQILAFLQRKKGINRLTRGPRGWGAPTWSGRGPLSHGHLGHRLALILLPKNHKYSKIILRPFLSRLDSVWYWVSAKQKTCNKQELALGTGSIC